MCSSGGEVATTDQALQKSQAAMTSTLNNEYQTTFAQNQRLVLGQQARLTAIANNPMGYTPEQLHAATTSINENTATAAKQALGSAAAFAAAHGGADVGSSVVGQMAGQIGSAAAQSKAQQLSALSQQSQQMKQQNMWSAIQGLQGVGAQLGAQGSTALSGAGTAAGDVIGAGEGVLKAKQAGWDELSGVLGGISGLAKSAVGFIPGVGAATKPWMSAAETTRTM
jgi:hypothetical protein